MRTPFYVGVMGLAVGVTFARSFTLATVLPQVEFGVYATLAAAGFFVSNLLSFGLVERTYKLYPRLWADSQRDVARVQCDGTVRVLFLRFLVCLPISAACALIANANVLAGLSVVSVAFGISMIGAYTSLHRATTDVYTLSFTTLARSVLSIILALFGALAFGLYGAILGEVAAAIVGALISRTCVIKLIRRLPTTAFSNVSVVTQELGGSGRWVFFGFLAAAAPMYLDRTFVTTSFGGSVAGTYAFLSLFVVAANTAVGILAQKIGPELIQMERRGASANRLLRYALRWIMLFWFAWLVGIICAAILLIEGGGVFGALNEKYGLNFPLFYAIAALGLVQISVLLDFILLSQDRERSLFVAAVTYLTATALVCGVVYYFGASLLEFLCMLAIAKLIHCVMQVSPVLLSSSFLSKSSNKRRYES